MDPMYPHPPFQNPPLNVYQQHHHHHHQPYLQIPNPNPNPEAFPLPGVEQSDSNPYCAAAVMPQVAVDGGGGYAIPLQPPMHPDYYHQVLAPAPNSFAVGSVGTGSTAPDLETKKRKIIEGGTRADSVRVCSLCSVVCNSEKVFAIHLAGEKHILKAQGNTPNASNPKVPGHVKALHLIKKAKTPRPKASAKKTSRGLITFVQSSYCDVCKINCSSPEIFNSHKLGRKHLKNLQKLSGTQLNYCDVCKINCDTQEVLDKHKLGKKHLKHLQKAQEPFNPTPKNEPAKKDMIGPVQPSLCVVCKIECNSREVLEKHNLGKKHLKNLKKLEDSMTPKPDSAPAINSDEKISNVGEGNTANEQPQQNAQKPKENVETKKQKVLSVGAQADSVKVCTYCNVVCNSETVYHFHIAGKKHTSMMRKQQLALAGQQQVASFPQQQVVPAS